MLLRFSGDTGQLVMVLRVTSACDNYMGDMFKPMANPLAARLSSSPRGPKSDSEYGWGVTHNQLSINCLGSDYGIPCDSYRGHPVAGLMGTDVAMLLPELHDRGELDGKN